MQAVELTTEKVWAGISEDNRAQVGVRVLAKFNYRMDDAAAIAYRFGTDTYTAEELAAHIATDETLTNGSVDSYPFVVLYSLDSSGGVVYGYHYRYLGGSSIAELDDFRAKMVASENSGS